MNGEKLSAREIKKRNEKKREKGRETVRSPY